MTAKVLIAGIGNVFQTDDAFGVEVVGRLHDRELPQGVRAEDFGIRGVHLAYELLNDYTHLVLVDALALGDEPGTLALVEASTEAKEQSPTLDAHTMSPDVVLATLAGLGGELQGVFVVGCQPESLEEGMGLTPRVAAVLDEAVAMCCQLAEEIIQQTEKEVVT